MSKNINTKASLKINMINHPKNLILKIKKKIWRKIKGKYYTHGISKITFTIYLFYSDF
jgi:hypothetical protein